MQLLIWHKPIRFACMIFCMGNDNLIISWESSFVFNGISHVDFFFRVEIVQECRTLFKNSTIFEIGKSLYFSIMILGLLPSSTFPDIWQTPYPCMLKTIEASRLVKSLIEGCQTCLCFKFHETLRFLNFYRLKKARKFLYFASKCTFGIILSF